MAEQSHLGKNEEKFKKIESKIDEVMSLLTSMMDEKGDSTRSSTSEPKDTLKIDRTDHLSKQYNQFNYSNEYTFTLKLCPID